MLLLVEDHVAVVDLAGGDFGDAGPANPFLAGARQVVPGRAQDI